MALSGRPSVLVAVVQFAQVWLVMYSGVGIGGGGLRGLEPPLFLALNVFYQEVHGMFCATN